MSTTNVAVFGGSFDPPHLGHLRNVIDLAMHPEVDQIEVIICFEHPFKKLTPFMHRTEMCYRNFRGMARVNLNYIEQNLGGASYSLRTLQALKKKHSDWNLRFVIGEDLVEEFKNWEGQEGISELAPLLVLPRDQYCFSTKIRQLVVEKEWDKVGKYVTPSVLAYLQGHPELYCIDKAKLLISGSGEQPKEKSDERS